jgi:hypothetical protein
MHNSLDPLGVRSLAAAGQAILPSIATLGYGRRR